MGVALEEQDGYLKGVRTCRQPDEVVLGWGGGGGSVCVCVCVGGWVVGWGGGIEMSHV